MNRRRRCRRRSHSQASMAAKRISRAETQTSSIYRVSQHRWAAAFLCSQRTASSVSWVFSKCRTRFRVVLFQTCLSAASCFHSFTLIPHFSKECFSKSLCLFFGAPTDLVPWRAVSSIVALVDNSLAFYRCDQPI